MHDQASGKFQFKESALDKTQGTSLNRDIFDLSLKSKSSLTLKQTRGAAFNAVPSAKPVAKVNNFVEKEHFFLKWCLPPSAQASKSPSTTAVISDEVSEDSSCLTIPQSGLYLVQFVCFTVGKQNDVFQLSLNDIPVLSTISDKAQMVIYHDQRQQIFSTFLSIG